MIDEQQQVECPSCGQPCVVRGGEGKPAGWRGTLWYAPLRQPTAAETTLCQTCGGVADLLYPLWRVQP